MSNAKVVFRNSSNVFTKDKVYTVKVNNNVEGVLDKRSKRLEFDLPLGKHLVKVESDGTSKEKEIIVLDGQIKMFTINAGVSYTYLMSFLLGLALVSIVCQFMILNKNSIPLGFISLIPIFILDKKNFPNSFEIVS